MSNLELVIDAENLPPALRTLELPDALTPGALVPILDDEAFTLPLARMARQRREELFGRRIHLRGIIEISSRCPRRCLYCGIRAGAHQAHRYTMSDSEIMARARMLPSFGYRTVVLQGGEDPAFDTERLCRLVERITRETALVVTLSLGEMPPEAYHALHQAGADRFLLRFETSNPELFARFHPDSALERRLAALEALREAGFQVGTGFIMGLPGSTLEDLARDILFTVAQRPGMIGSGPYIPPEPGMLRNSFADRPGVFHRAMALLRILAPWAHIPATTAFDSIGGGGREALLLAGCNVFMANLTPEKYREQYALYPKKAATDTSRWHFLAVPSTLENLGLTVAGGAGHALVPPPQEVSNA